MRIAILILTFTFALRAMSISDFLRGALWNEAVLEAAQTAGETRNDAVLFRQSEERGPGHVLKQFTQTRKISVGRGTFE